MANREDLRFALVSDRRLVAKYLRKYVDYIDEPSKNFIVVEREGKQPRVFDVQTMHAEIELELWLHKNTLDPVHELDLETVRAQHISGLPTFIAFLDESEQSKNMLEEMRKVQKVEHKMLFSYTDKPHMLSLSDRLNLTSIL